MAAAGFKGTVTLTVDASGARLTDGVTGHTVELTELEGRLLDLFFGQTPEALASQAQAAGIGLWPDQVRVVLERIEAHGFLARPLGPESSAGPSLGPSDVVPRFRSDLSLSKAPGSRSAIHVVDPVTQQAFSLFDFEASIARMLNGSRTVNEVITLASKIGIPVTTESLDRFVRQLRSFGFLDSNATAAPATAWDPRDAWSPEIRELFQAALRLMRGGNPQQALNYIDAMLQTNPNLPEAIDLRARAEAAIAGTLDLTLPFNELHGGAPADPPPPGRGLPDLPPPPPDENTAEHKAVVPPPPVARVEGLGILPPPRTSPPRAAAPELIPAPPPRGSAPRPAVAEAAAAPAPRTSAPRAASPVLAPTASARATLVFGSGAPAVPPVKVASLLGPQESSSGPRQFNSVLFGAQEAPATEPHPIASAPPGRRLAPPNASPPPRGAEALAGPLGVSDTSLPTVDAEMASQPPRPSQPPPPVGDTGPSVQVDSLAFVPQGTSQQGLGAVGSGFSAEDGDAAGGMVSVPSAESLASTSQDPAFNANHLVSGEALAFDGAAPVKKRGRGLTILAVLVTLIAAATAVPVPHPVEAACVVAPMVLAEPRVLVDGTVAELVVKPGDVVAAGTVLVKMTVADPPEAKTLADQEADARSKIEKLKVTVKGSAKAKKALVALGKADKDLVKAKAALAKVESAKKVVPADKAKAKKALEAKQKARDKAQAAADVETAAKKIAALEAEAETASAERAKLLQNVKGSIITAPAPGRFEPPNKHAVGLGFVAGEAYGRMVDPGLWKVTASELPPATEPSSAKIKLQSGRLVDLTGVTLSGDGPTRQLEGNALLTDDATSAGTTILQVRAGKRPLAVLLIEKAKTLLR